MGIIAPGKVATASIENEAVTTEKIAANAITPSKINNATTPAPGAEKAIVLGVAGVVRKLIVAITGDGVKTAWAIEHNFAVTRGIVAIAVSASGEKLPGEQPTTALGKWVNESANIGTYTFTAAPIAKAEVFIILIG